MTALLNHTGTKYLMLFFATFVLISCNEESKVSQSVPSDSLENHTTLPEDSSFESTSNDVKVIPEGNDESHSINPKTVELVRQVLANEILKSTLDSIPKNNRRFMVDEIDLNNDHKKEIFVGVSGSHFCSAGGCIAFLLTSTGKLITQFTFAKYPIVVRPFSTNGWKDLVIGSAGKKPSIHLIKWKGKQYPANPTQQPEFSQLPSEKSIRVLNCVYHTEHWFDF